MGDRLDQRVAPGGMAIQSSRDTNIYPGVRPEDVRQIVESLADQIPKMAAIASAIIEERLNSFKKEIIERFESDPSVNRDAFKDPDFIDVLVEAQRGYTRIGDNEAHETLIDLIAERSKQDSGSRLAFTINEAVSVANKLTRSELSELALSFLVRSTTKLGNLNIALFGEYYQIMLAEFLEHVEIGQHSYNYLVSQRCATISIASVGVIECWRQAYTGLFFKGITYEEFGMIVDPSLLSDTTLFISTLFNQVGLQPNSINLESFKAICASRGVSTDKADAIWTKSMTNVLSEEEFIGRFERTCPLIREAVKKWQDSPLKSLDLTAVGLTVAHARATQVKAFGEPDLKMWVN